MSSNDITDTANAFIAQDDGSDPETNQTTELVDAVLDIGAELFHAADRTTYVTLGIAGHFETLPLETARFKSWLRKSSFELFRKAVTGQVISEATAILSAFAEHNGKELKVYRRVAEYEGTIYIDLVNEARNVVRVDLTGWEVIDSPREVKFIRSQGMKALPYPEERGDLEGLRRFVNVTDEEWPLLVGFIVGVLNPRGPYPACVLTGDQGTAKSTCARLIRAITDPHVIESDTLPRNGTDLAIAAGNSHLLSYDNVSKISEEMSNILCRLSTGGGIRKRKLYYDSVEVMIPFNRPVILNGIGDIVAKQDLIDRAIFLHLQPIEETARRTEEEIMNEFEDAAPFIFSGLLYALAAAIRNKGSVPLGRNTRLADFATFICESEEALPINPGAFITAYQANRAGANAMVLEDSLVAAAIVNKFDVSGQGEWTGSASELVEWLTPGIDDSVRKAKGWPVTGRSMRNELDRVSANLRSAGLRMEPLPRTGRSRRFAIRRATVTSVTPSPPSSVLDDEDDDSDGRELASARVPGSTTSRDISDGPGGSLGTQGRFEGDI